MTKAPSVTGEEIIDQLHKRFKTQTNSELAKKIGVTNASISQWKNRKTITARQVIELVLNSQNAAREEVQREGIRPVVEFFPLEKNKIRNGNNYEIFKSNGGPKNPHPYLSGLKAELEKHHGVYVFFDSSGRAIYAGKARRQKLWKEMNLAFNRDRSDLQTIKRVHHPSTKSSYKTSDEKSRQIVEVSVPMHELAAYVSAYVVSDGLIPVVEAMLVRSFANDLLNKRMERFGMPKKATKRKPSASKNKSV